MKKYFVYGVPQKCGQKVGVRAQNDSPGIIGGQSATRTRAVYVPGGRRGLADSEGSSFRLPHSVHFIGQFGESGADPRTLRGSIVRRFNGRTRAVYKNGVSCPLSLPATSLPSLNSLWKSIPIRFQLNENVSHQRQVLPSHQP